MDSVEVPQLLPPASCLSQPYLRQTMEGPHLHFVPPVDEKKKEKVVWHSFFIANLVFINLHLPPRIGMDY